MPKEARKARGERGRRKEALCGQGGARKGRWPKGEIGPKMGKGRLGAQGGVKVGKKGQGEGRQGRKKGGGGRGG